AADDIAGLNAAQLSKRLTIDPSDAFTVIRFPTPNSGLATPINRLDKGFIGGGRTAGGAREFVLPNQPIPPGATIEVVR
ncbi:MAG: polymorphic toxin type 10 domain-containing protein, partial [Nitrososphaera sp.]|nr:polymorphic toxin type 10 domain-containing protein [Nitrososphaera sp.]